MRRILTPVWSFLFLLFLVFSARAQNININFVGHHEPNTSSTIFYGDVWGEGDLACLGIWRGYTNVSNPYGVGIYNIANPANPIYLTNYFVSTNANHNQFELGAVRNKIGYFGSWSGGGLHIVSLTNAASPVRLAKLDNAGSGFNSIHTVFLERNFLYEAAHVSGVNTVKVIDVSNPSAPVFVRDIVSTNAYKVHQITAVTKGASTILYTSDFGNPNNPGAFPGETDIWDVSNVGTQPAVWLGRIVSGASSHSSWPTPDGNTLIVAQEFFGGDVRFYDISNPAAPVLQTVISTASMGLPAATPHNPVVVSNLLFLSWYQNGIQIFDITDRTKPVRIGTYDTFPGTWTTSFEGNWGVFPNFGLNKLLLSDIQSGFYILDASAVLTGTNNYPPLIVSQPTSVTVTQGMSATFTAVATGSSPKYQWKRNNANISGATSSSLVVSNAQPIHAGNYTVLVTNATGTVTSSAASLNVLVQEQPMEIVFYENFDSASSSNNWNLFDGFTNEISDYTVDWSFDYSTYFSTFNGANIPPAPNSTNGTTLGLRLTVNDNDAIAATAAVSLYPKNQNFSGAYKLKFDMWINYPGTAGGAGSSGSTEHATFGINHTGTRINWQAASSTPSDGVWFGVDGEGGSSSGQDYRAYEGNPVGQPTFLSFAASGFSASGAASRDNLDGYFQSIFPSPTYETPGVPGKKWTQVEISRDINNILKWKMNDHLIAQRMDTSSFTNGTIMIGYMDLFNSIAFPPEDAFVLFDNVRVEASVAGTPAQITAHPQDAAVYPGQEATFTVAATGTGPLNFQWRFNGQDISGATNGSLIISNVQPEFVGSYSVLVFNNYGSANSSDASLSILDSPFLNTIAAAPGSRSALISWKSTVPADSLVQFSVANGTVQSPSSMSAMGASFADSSYIDRTLSTNHTILLTGLTPGTLYSFQVISTAETNSYVSGVYQFTTAGTLIVDNPDAVFSGGWTETSFSSDRYGTNYRFANSVVGSVTATATFRPNLPSPGKYDVEAFYPEGSNRANNAPYTISYNGGSQTVAINQQTGGGEWQPLVSERDFLQGTSGFVKLGNNANPTVVIADAVRFTYVDSQEYSTNDIPAWWETFYFGADVNPSDDPDGDEYTTLEEYLAGTSPADANSHLQLEVQAAGSSANVTFWPYLGNRNYQLLFKTNLSDTSWEVLSPGTITTTPYGHGIFSLSTATVDQGFYRLAIQLVPTGSFSGKIAIAQGDAFTGFSEAACGVNRVFAKPRTR